MSMISNFATSFAMFDSAGNLLDWDDGFALEFHEVAGLLLAGSSVQALRAASLLPASALDFSWLLTGLAPAPMLYLNNRLSVEVRQERSANGAILRLARVIGEAQELAQEQVQAHSLTQQSNELLRSSALQMSAAILAKRSEEQEALATARAEAQAAHQKLSSVLKFNETILLNSPLPIGVYAASGQCVEANDAYAELVGATRAALLAQNFRQNNVWKSSGLLDECLSALAQQRPQQREVQAVSSFGKQIWLECRILPTHLNGEIHLLIQFIDLSERKRIEDELRQLAFHDALTRLPNRRLLLDRLQQALRTRKRNRSQIAVLFIDLDKFKSLNDAHGHEAGDQLLIEVALRLLRVVRETDTVARLGGDEFVVLLEGLNAVPRQAASYVGAVVEKIRLAVSEPYFLGQIRHIGSASIGIKLVVNDELDPEHILKDADAAMYEIKKRNYSPRYGHDEKT